MKSYFVYALPISLVAALASTLVACGQAAPADNAAGPAAGNDAGGSPSNPDNGEAGDSGTPGNSGSNGHDAGGPSANPPPNTNGCTAESDAQLCTKSHAVCGVVRTTDKCGTKRVVASCGSCDAGLVCGDGAQANRCVAPPDDPALDDPARPSFQYECQGTPLTPTEIAAFVHQAKGVLWLGVPPNESSTVDGPTDWVQLSSVRRTCNPVTGCTDWAVPSFDIPVKMLLGFVVDASGGVSIVEIDTARPANTIAGTAFSKGDFQVDLAPDDSVPQKTERYKVRVTRESDGTLCTSLATKVTTEPSAVANTTLSYFEFGSDLAAAAVPRTTYAAPASATPCASTTLATDDQIRTRFAPGGLSIDLAAQASTSVSHACHPVTGCSAYTTGSAEALKSIVVQGSGFAVELADGSTMPISNGRFGTASAGGHITADHCIDYHATFSDDQGAFVSLEGNADERGGW